MAIRIKSIGGTTKMRATASAIEDDDTKYHTREEWKEVLEMGNEPTTLDDLAAEQYGERPQPMEIDPVAIYARFNRRD